MSTSAFTPQEIITILEIAQSCSPVKTGNAANAILVVPYRDGVQVKYQLSRAFYIEFLNNPLFRPRIHNNYIDLKTVSALIQWLGGLNGDKINGINSNPKMLNFLNKDNIARQQVLLNSLATYRDTLQKYNI